MLYLLSPAKRLDHRTPVAPQVAVLATPEGRDLYAFWGDTLAEYANRQQGRERTPIVVNLASFDAEGHAFDRTVSTAERLVFRRHLE